MFIMYVFLCYINSLIVLKMYSSSGHPKHRRVSFIIRTDLEKFSIMWLAHQRIGAVRKSPNN